LGASAVSSLAGSAASSLGASSLGVSSLAASSVSLASLGASSVSLDSSPDGCASSDVGASASVYVTHKMMKGVMKVRSMTRG